MPADESRGVTPQPSGLDHPDPPKGKPLSVADRVSHLLNSYANKSGIIDNKDKTIVVDQGPLPLRHPVTDEVLGYEVWVRAFDSDGDLQVDPHRQFINPPDGRRLLDDGTVTQSVDAATLVEDMLRQTVTL